MLSPLQALVPVAALIAAAAHGAEGPRVVVTVLPVHSLVAGVMTGIGAPVLLLPGGASPHSYMLRPSDVRAIGGADVIFRLSPRLETFLEKPLANLAARARVVTLAEADGLVLLPARRNGRADGPIDPHLWLDPANAKAMVGAVVAALAAADPSNGDRYGANGQAMKRRLDALDGNLRRRLAPVAGRPYVVFHDAFRYFEGRYGLNVVGALTPGPERAPGARRITRMRHQIRSLGVSCVFGEPQFSTAVLDSLTEGTGTRIAMLDPLGAGLKPGPDAYFGLLGGLARSLAACLAPRS